MSCNSLSHTGESPPALLPPFPLLKPISMQNQTPVCQIKTERKKCHLSLITQPERQNHPSLPSSTSGLVTYFKVLSIYWCLSGTEVNRSLFIDLTRCQTSHLSDFELQQYALSSPVLACLMQIEGLCAHFTYKLVVTVKCKETHCRNVDKKADMSFRLKNENQGKLGASFLIKKSIQ